jgi:hypothetical protein
MMQLIFYEILIVPGIKTGWAKVRIYVFPVKRVPGGIFLKMNILAIKGLD